MMDMHSENIKNQNMNNPILEMRKKEGERLSVQDGRVEGYALISSCENTKIATNC